MCARVIVTHVACMIVYVAGICSLTHLFFVSHTKLRDTKMRHDIHNNMMQIIEFEFFER